MPRHLVLVPLAALVLGACPSESTSRETTDGRSPEATPTPVEPEPTDPELPTEAPPLPKVGVAPVAGECPPLTALGKSAPTRQRELVPLLAALRGVSCQAAVFGMSEVDALRSLAVADGVTVHLGRRYATVELAEPVALIDVLAVAGVTGAKLRLEQGWSSVWRVVDQGGEDRPRPWPPGELNIHLPGERNDESADGTFAEISPEMLIHGSISISMPESALSFETDAFAAAAIAAALEAMASDRALLSSEPATAHTALASLGERFSVSSYSVGLGAEQRKGFALRPHRTELIADQFATALKLPEPAHVQIDITDTNPNRLASAGAPTFVWKGLEVEVELRERQPEQFGLAGWVVEEVVVLPAPTGR